MKKTIIVVVVLVVALVAGLAVYFYSKGIGPTEEVTPGMEEEVAEVDYPVGDKTPEHVAEVLGSYERYEELQDSQLRKPDTKMQIAYDTHRGQRIYWVAMVMRGEVVKIEGRVIAIANEGETISLDVPEFAKVYIGGILQSEETEFEKLEIGDWLCHISVVINADRAEARVIRIG